MEKIDIDLVCEYLRIYDADNGYLRLAIDSAYSYIEAAIEDFEVKYQRPKFKNRADIVILAVISELYDNRVMTKNAKYDSPSKMVQSMMTQLQLEV